MASSGPTSLLGNLFNLASEIVQTFFGSSTPNSEPAPVRLPSPAVKRGRSVTVKEGRQHKAKKRKVIDLTADSDDVEIIEVRDRVQSIDLTQIPDETPKELAQAESKKRRNIALTFQYANKLGIAPGVENIIKLKKIGKDRYQLQSPAFAKHNTKNQSKILEDLVALTENMDIRDAQMLLRNEWLNDTLIEKYFGLLEKNHKNTRMISPLLSDQRDFSDRVRNNPNYLRDRASLKTAKRIFMPMNANSHWYLVVLDKGKNGKYTLSCMDSFNTKTDRFLDVAANFLQALYPERELADLVTKQQHIDIPKQHNALDCGVAISYWAREISSTNALPNKPKGTCDYSQFRFDMAESFARDQAEKLEKDKPIKILDSLRKSAKCQ